MHWRYVFTWIINIRGAFKKFIAWRRWTQELVDITSQVNTNHYYLLAQVNIGLTYLWWFYSMVLSAPWVSRMLTDVQKADHAETSTSLLTLFNENPDNFISRFVTVDESWLHHFDPESKAQRLARKHVTSLPPRKFHMSACVMATVCWDSEGIVLIDYLEHGRISEHTMLNWSENVKRHWKRGDEESCDAVCCFIRTMHLLIRHHKHWPPFKMQVLTCSATHRIH